SKGGEDAEAYRGDTRNRGSESEQPPVHIKGHRDGPRTDRQHAQQTTPAVHADPHTNRGPTCGEDEDLGECLPHKAPTPGSEREPDRYFFCPRDAPREH